MAKKKTIYYEFCGDGQGVPGLPRRVSRAEAATLGMADALEAAIANGNYRAAENQVLRASRKLADAGREE